eukprot:1990314-Prymnesium_polylepis.1
MPLAPPLPLPTPLRTPTSKGHNKRQEGPKPLPALSLPRGPTHAPLSFMRAPIARSPEPLGPGTPNLDLSSPSRAPPHA